jgi:hypothetical protein
LDRKAKMAKGLVFRLIRFMKFHQARGRAHQKMSMSYRTIAGRDSTHAAFFDLGNAHQKLEHADRFLIDGMKPIISDILTFTGINSNSYFKVRIFFTYHLNTILMSNTVFENKAFNYRKKHL